jgi:hypothetical protein
MTPGEVIASQGGTGEMFSIEVRDNNGNPYAFERVQLDLYCDNGAFPGYLSIREWGLPVKLGQSVVGKTNEKGQLSVRFIPPGGDRVEFRGPRPTETYVDLPYPVHPDNHGNPSVHQEDGSLVSISGITTSMRVYPVTEGGNAVYHLTGAYPKPNSLVVQLEAPTGGLGYPLGETYSPIIDAFEFNTNYEQGKLTVRGTNRLPARIVFEPRTVWRDPKFPSRLYFDARYLDQVTGDLVVRYDAFARLQVRALPPEGIDTEVDAWREFDSMIMQNPNRGDV